MISYSRIFRIRTYCWIFRCFFTYKGKRFITFCIVELSVSVYGTTRFPSRWTSVGFSISELCVARFFKSLTCKQNRGTILSKSNVRHWIWTSSARTTGTVQTRHRIAGKGPLKEHAGFLVSRSLTVFSAPL